MKQVIRYLYEYENGNRIRNVGFIKLEKRMDKCAIHIHGKNLDFGGMHPLRFQSVSLGWSLIV